MKFIDLDFPGLKLVQRDVAEDSRGFFTKLYCSQEFAENSVEFTLKQINISFTKKSGSIRGMHYQRNPYGESKIVTCLRGAIWDVSIDIRRNSPNFLRWHSQVLSAEEFDSLIIPPGFAHGFQTLTDDVEIVYIHSQSFNEAHDAGIRYDDPRIGITWPEPIAEISVRDLGHSYIREGFSGEDG